MNTTVSLWFVPLVIVVQWGVCWAFQPLITDDTGTQGKGNYSMELSLERGWLKWDDRQQTRTGGVSIAYAGIREDTDLILTVPYTTLRSRDHGVVTRGTGIDDITLESLWRFYEKGPWSFAIKPGITMPTGNAEKNLGAGKVRYGGFLIGMRELLPFLVVFSNLGYLRNENVQGSRRDIFHLSVAGALDLTRSLRLVADTGVETATDPTTGVPPAYFLGGFVYTVSQRVDVDAGLLRALTKTEEQWRVLAGITIRF